RSVRPVDAHRVGSPTLEYHEPEPVWLIPGKEAGKNYRLRAFVPNRANAHGTASNEKPQSWQSLARRERLARHSHNLCSQPSHWGAVMTRTLRAACLTMILALCVPVSAGATSRIKDLTNIEGVRQNQLIGYGLVVGLNGTGDTLNNIPFTKQSLT